MKPEWLPLAFPELLGWSLLHSLWQFLLLAGVYGLVIHIRFFRIPRYRYLAGLTTLFIMFLCFLTTVVYECQILAPDAGVPETYARALPEREAYRATLPASSLEVVTMASTLFERVLPYLVNLWFIGVVFYMLRLLSNFVALQQIKKRSSAILPQWVADKAEAYLHNLHIGLPVSVRKSEEIEVPMVFGILKPMVLIPAGLVLNMPARQLEAILVHELAHVRRQDFLINLFQSFLEMIFFYHPAFWWINESVRESREQATDDLAIESGVNSSDLAHALAYIVNRAAKQAPELAMAAHKSAFPTLHRIQRMMGRPSTKITSSPLITKTMMITCMLSFILLLGTAGQEDLPQEHWLETNLKYTNAYSFDRDLQLPFIPDSNSHDSLPGSSVRPIQLDIEVEIDTTVQTTIYLDSLPEMPALVIPSPPAFPELHPFIHNGFMEGFGDSIRLYTSKIVHYHMDSTPDGLAHKEKFERKMKELQQKMAAAQEVFEEKMKEWEAEFKPKMEEFEVKMEAWRKENEPRIQEFEAKMEAWSKQQEAKFDAIEEKMRARQEKIKEVEESVKNHPSDPDR